MKEKEILDKFRHGDGPHNEEIKMFKLALKRYHEEEDELVKISIGHIILQISFQYNNNLATSQQLP